MKETKWALLVAVGPFSLLILMVALLLAFHPGNTLFFAVIPITFVITWLWRLKGAAGSIALVMLLAIFSAHPLAPFSFWWKAAFYVTFAVSHTLLAICLTEARVLLEKRHAQLSDALELLGEEKNTLSRALAEKEREIEHLNLEIKRGRDDLDAYRLLAMTCQREMEKTHAQNARLLEESLHYSRLQEELTLLREEKERLNTTLADRLELLNTLRVTAFEREGNSSQTPMR